MISYLLTCWIIRIYIYISKIFKKQALASPNFLLILAKPSKVFHHMLFENGYLLVVRIYEYVLLQGAFAYIMIYIYISTIFRFLLIDVFLLICSSKSPRRFGRKALCAMEMAFDARSQSGRPGMVKQTESRRCWAMKRAS